MNSTTVTLSVYLANVQIQIIRSLLTPVYIISNLTNLANILIFLQPTLRSHVCSYYFIGASLAHLLYLNMGCSTRVIWAWTGYDLSLKSLIFCQTRVYFVIFGLSASRYLLCLISIDRWMITSRNALTRQLSSSKTARRMIIGGIVFLLLIIIHAPFAYVLTDTIPCGPSPQSNLFMLYTIYNVALSLTPLITLVIFSLLILYNIEQLRSQRIAPVEQTSVMNNVSHAGRQYKKKDMQFIRLALIQVAAYLIFNTLHAYNTIYAVATQNRIKTADQRALEGFLNGIGLNLHYTYTGITFFLYTMASVSFRKICIDFLRRPFKHPLALRHE
ncbi:unnamed protein product [Adineta ricciae]|uniref:G-protein coupled receptors family 1 profile domain-containing protein n=1 Tax=Adineta ricciae TaxID=249248 RepID=A0A816DC48_ADIRI|nr:unnamed protein product [Adineta ricciae]